MNIRELNNIDCPVRTIYGCETCPILGNEANCIGLKIARIDEKIADAEEQCEKLRPSLEDARQRARTLAQKHRKARERVEDLAAQSDTFKSRVAELRTIRKRAMRADKFAEHVKGVVEQLQKKAVEDTAPGKKNGSSELHTLCSQCAVCTCEWMAKKPSPVPGWEAVQSKIYADGYVVIKCPKYVAMPERHADNMILSPEQFRAMNGIKPGKKHFVFKAVQEDYDDD